LVVGEEVEGEVEEASNNEILALPMRSSKWAPFSTQSKTRCSVPR